MKRNIFYILIIVAFSVGLYFLINSTLETEVKCSDDYPNTDTGSAEYIADFDKWTNDFYDKHPGATLFDWSKARYQFWVDNDCTASLEGYEEAKKWYS